MTTYSDITVTEMAEALSGVSETARAAATWSQSEVSVTTNAVNCTILGDTTFTGPASRATIWARSIKVVLNEAGDDALIQFTYSEGSFDPQTVDAAVTLEITIIEAPVAEEGEEQEENTELIEIVIEPVTIPYQGTGVLTIPDELATEMDEAVVEAKKAPEEKEDHGSENLRDVMKRVTLLEAQIEEMQAHLDRHPLHNFENDD